MFDTNKIELPRVAMPLGSTILGDMWHIKILALMLEDAIIAEKDIPARASELCRNVLGFSDKWSPNPPEQPCALCGELVMTQEWESMSCCTGGKWKVAHGKCYDASKEKFWTLMGDPVNPT